MKYSKGNNYRSNSGRSDNNKKSEKDYVKHSGCSSGQDKNGNPYYSAWNYSRRDGMTKIFVAPYKGTAQHKTKTGQVYENWMAKITVGKNQPYIQPVLVSHNTEKIVIDHLGWVLNPHAPDGGYCGKFTNSTRS